MPRRIVARLGRASENLLRLMNPSLKLSIFGVGTMMPLAAAIFDAGKVWQLTAALTVVLISIGSCIEITRIGHEAGRDFLTKLLNRRSLYNAISSLLRGSEKESTGFCIALIDLDQFKRLNDTLGHKAGDEALKIVAELLRHLFRGSDIIARLGGDEFALVLPRARISDAREKLEQFRELVAGDRRLSFKDAHLLDYHITASVGLIDFACNEINEAVASNNGDGNGQHSPIEKMLHQADELLYKAKERGRNRVVARESPDE